MPLEFALRPRFDLERTAPQRRRRRARLPRLALSVLGYWAAIALGTRALIGALAEHPAETAATAEVPAEEPALAAPEPPVIAAAEAPPVAEPSEPPGATANEAAVAAANEPAVVAPSEPPSDAAPSESLPVVARFESAPLPVHTEPPPPMRAEPPLTARREPRAPERAASLAPMRTQPRAAERAFSSAFDPFAPSDAFEPPKIGPSEPTVSPPAAKAPARDEARAGALPSCEAAATAANETMDLRGAGRAPDLPRETFGAVLNHGAYLARCAVPARTALQICAAVQDGRVVGVSVSSEPPSAAINACVRREVAGLRFPRSPHVDVTRTRFEAAH